jgi:hypothetical protein
MPKYKVRVQVSTPTVYEIEADSPLEAELEAVERYMKEHDPWIKPKVEVSEI